MGDSFTVEDFFLEEQEDRAREEREEYERTRNLETDFDYCATQCNIKNTAKAFMTSINFMNQHGHELSISEALDIFITSNKK